MISNKLLELGGYSVEQSICVTKTQIINLDRRKDRYNDLINIHPFLKTAERISAVDGKTLQLTKGVSELFRRNDFKWKKSVMGCALSHIHIWKKLANESDDTRYLILEDDVRFSYTVSEINKKLHTLPNDAELVYLGGVLPTNKPHLESVLEPISEDWSKIKKNTLFTKEPTELFHFCTYSYILTKSGAQKLLNILNISGCFTSVDHLLNHPQIPIIKYIASPLITSCFQENDPTYIHSDFNNFNRVDNFDSDIWNNNEHFTESDINIAQQDTQQDIQQNTVIYYLKEYSPNTPFELYERKWIEYLFGNIELRELSTTEKPEPNAWYLVMRPHSDFFKNYFLQLGVSYNVLHLSDEFISDNIDFYSYKNCKKVIRNYHREDTKHLTNVYTIPLGYHYKSQEGIIQDFDSRKLSWSFHGTDWFDRKSKLEKIQNILPYNCHLTPNWNHETMSSEEKYSTTLSSSKFCPILRGNNIETFRLYEALEAGTIPIYVRGEGDTVFWNKITSKIPMVHIETWEKASIFMKYLLNNPEKGEIYRKGLLEKWNEWKMNIKENIQNP
jgi:GR25 family glycosyltransferase involved in LPS biosynthesis